MIKAHLNKSMAVLGMMEAIMPGSVERILGKGQCPSCGHEIQEGEFKNEISLREFHISGLCQKCQDDIWK